MPEMYSTFITKFKTELNTRYSNAIKEIHDIIWNKFISIYQLNKNDYFLSVNFSDIYTQHNIPNKLCINNIISQVQEAFNSNGYITEISATTSNYHDNYIVTIKLP